ncbi:Ubiquitin carboxyl-terminal hydrolase 24, partial [Armadillidium nasatum]
KLMRKRYELVGVIVHSGQANAGHYYSYIKDRRGDPISNPNKSKWFKFNDTTVEHVEMTNALLEQECFGGTYKAKVSYDSSNPMPEDRLRYWNAYMLFYDTIDDLSCTPKTPKTPRITGRTSRSLRASASSARKNLSLGGTTSDSKSVISSSDLATSPSSSRDNNPEFVRAAQTSLCELSELLKRGEKQGMFRQQMPPRILATITHDNLTFLRDKDLYSMDYFNFIYNACYLALETFKQEKGVNSEMLVDAVSLGLKFLLNTYLRTRGKEVSVVQRWLELLTEILEKERMATSWCVHYFVSEGELHIQPLLLECPDKMVRVHFGNLLNTIITYECKQTQGTASVEGMIKNLLSLLTSEVSAHGPLQCEQMLKLGGFEALMQFLLGPSESNMRRWSPVHAQDFGPLHSIIAALILHSDASIKQMSKAEPLDEDYDNPNINTSQHSCGLPSAVADVVYGLQRDQWLKEVVLAYREVVGGIPQLTEALKLLSREDSNFSFALIAAIMSLQDSLHSDRIGAVLSVFYSSQGTEIHGLLNLIEANKDSDSRRAYQCIKLIVYLAARSNVAREQLTDTQTNWQWAVEWLKSKMDSHPLGVSGVGGSNVSDLASGSNEDSSSRSFQRTTSAQWTLDEATALLSGMESIDMEIEPEGDEDEELADIKESPENDNNPSVGEFTSDS